MREIYIYGDIVDKESDKISPEDVCPQDIIAQTKETDEDLTIRINSCGGSVSAGLSIATYLQSLKQKTTCIVDGVAASIASVIACSGDELVMHPSSYLMVHRVWGNVVGNSEDLRKEADTMEKMTNSLIKIYQRKFDLSEDEIAKLLADETWISGEQISDYKIKATVDGEDGVKYAAKLVDKMKKFNKQPIIMKNEEKKPEEEVKQEETPVETPVEEEKPAEEQKQEETPDPLEELKRENEELKRENEELKKQIEELTKQIEELKSQDVEKRVSGMQSKMQNKINDLTKDFQNKLETMTKELDSYKTECISLKNQLEESTKSVGELQAKVSALTDEVTQKQTALDQLNSGVLTHPTKADPVNWRNLTGRDFLDYLARHPEIINQK